MDNDSTDDDDANDITDDDARRPCPMVALIILMTMAVAVAWARP